MERMSTIKAWQISMRRSHQKDLHGLWTSYSRESNTGGTANPFSASNHSHSRFMPRWSIHTLYTTKLSTITQTNRLSYILNALHAPVTGLATISEIWVKEDWVVRRCRRTQKRKYAAGITIRCHLTRAAPLDYCNREVHVWPDLMVGPGTARLAVVVDTNCRPVIASIA